MLVRQKKLSKQTGPTCWSDLSANMLSGLHRPLRRIISDPRKTILDPPKFISDPHKKIFRPTRPTLKYFKPK